MSLPIPELDNLSPDDKVTVEEIHHAPMQHAHSISRVLALQALYELDMTGHPMGEVMNSLNQRLDRTTLEDDVTVYASRLVEGVLRYREGLDAAIQPFAPEFPVRHLAAIDRCILRLAVYEYAIANWVPVGVAIDEAVSLAKQYGADSSARFVNGVLGNLMDREEVVARLRTLTA
ncbi:MAG: transcription antitermination factor NusB [Anaerolineae bacterium]|jgi:N utilization substance protein B|nr:transcription antitermination factor NusB [Anaerolineae bacterium]